MSLLATRRPWPLRPFRGAIFKSGNLGTKVQRITAAHLGRKGMFSSDFDLILLYFCQYGWFMCKTLVLRLHEFHFWRPRVALGARAAEWSIVSLKFRECSSWLSIYIPGSAPGCRTGNGEKLSSTQAEQSQDIKSAVA